MLTQETLYPPQTQKRETLIQIPTPVTSTTPSKRMTHSGDKLSKNMSLRLTLRDMQILDALHRARYLATYQIQALFWTESHGGEHGLKKACERRMRMLHEADLVRRVEQPTKRGEGTKPFIYALSNKGATVLISELGVDPNGNSGFI